MHGAQSLTPGVVLVPVRPQILHADHAFHRHVGQLHKQPEFHQAGNHAMKDLAFPAAQSQTGHTARHFPLRVHGSPLPPVETVGHTLQPLPRRQGAGIHAQRVFQHAMHRQIRIAANGRGKMAVGLRRKAEVPFVTGLIPGLRHGPQAETVDQKFLLRAPRPQQGRPQASGTGRRTRRRRGLKRRGPQRIKEAFQPLGIGQRMHAVQERRALLAR